MATRVTVALLLLTASAVVLAASDLNYRFTTASLPSPDVMPTLANGFIGFVPYGDAVHMNGVYNGLAGLSHRARIPNYANVQLSLCSSQQQTRTNCNFQLDMQTGKFITVYEDPNSAYRLVHEVYPHRYVESVIVNRVRIQRLGSIAPIQAQLVRITNPTSVDFTFQQPLNLDIGGSMYTQVCGKTTQVEDPVYQQFGHDVCVTYPNLPAMVSIDSETMAQEFVLLTSFTAVATDGVENIFAILSPVLEATRHSEQMAKMWELYGISVEGNNVLDRAVKASAFYLFSSLPAQSVHPQNTGKYAFYGLAPAGLGRGGIELQEYQGHSFWDTEMWMYPPILLMDPQNAARVLHYRTVVSRASADIAQSNQYAGWQYAWESAYSGREVTPDCCQEVIDFQHHITADIAYASRLYYYATGDVSWMENEGCRLAYETAKFWRSRVQYNNVTDTYDIRRAMGPDEDHPNVTNNVYTNIVAAHNLFLGEFAGCYCKAQLGITDDEHQEFVRIAKSLTLLYDAERDYHPQYDGYQQGTPIKQADTVLLIYPLEFPMNASTKANNLRIYSEVTRSNGPAMTWGIHAIGHLELGQQTEASAMFERSYSQYMRAPFNVWSENGNGEAGAGNFITGAGGFLQAIINGYADVRLRHGELVIRNSQVLPNSNGLDIHNIQYMGSKFSLHITPTVRSINFQDSTVQGVRLFIDGSEIREICTDCNHNFTQEVILRPAAEMVHRGCKLHPTTLGMMLKDQNGGSTSLQSTPATLVFLLGAYLLSKWTR